MAGWVKLWRKSLESGLLQNHELWAFWCWCLLKATHKEHKQMVGWQTVELQPGQFIFGRKQAASELALTERKIRTCAKKLENLGNLTINSTNKYSIITIVNWETYQQSDQQSDQQNDQRVTSGRPASDHKQEGKKGKKEEYPSDFERFWSAYPVKKKKKEALKAWNKAKQDLPPIDDLVEIVEKNKRLNKQWLKDGGQFIPHPATWLNAGQWLDELEADSSSRKSPEYVT